MFELQIENWKEIQKALSPDVINKSMNLAIKRGLMKTRTQVSKNVRQVYAVNAGAIGKTVTLKRLTFNPPAYLLQWAAKRIQLRKFGARARIIRSSRGLRKGVSVRVRKDRGRKVVQGGFYGPGGYPVYKRVEGHNKKIEKRTGIAIPQMVATSDQMDQAYDFMGKEFPKQFVSAMDFYTKKAAGLI